MNKLYVKLKGDKSIENIMNDKLEYNYMNVEDNEDLKADWLDILMFPFVMLWLIFITFIFFIGGLYNVFKK